MSSLRMWWLAYAHFINMAFGEVKIKLIMRLSFFNFYFQVLSDILNFLFEYKNCSLNER